MVYQRVAKPSSESFQTPKKDSFGTASAISIQAKLDSALSQEQEMPSYTPLAANWVSNNPLMRSLNEAETQKPPLQLSNATNTIQRKINEQDLVDRGLVNPWKQASDVLNKAKHLGGKAILDQEKKRLQNSWKLEATTIDQAEKEIKLWIAEVDIMKIYNSNFDLITQTLESPKNALDKSVGDSAKSFKGKFATEIETLSWQEIKQGMNDNKSTYRKYIDRIKELAVRQGTLKDPKEEAQKKHLETLSSPDWRYQHTNIGITKLFKEGVISMGKILEYYPTSYDDATKGETSIKVSINNMTKYVVHAHIKADGKVNNNGKSPVHVKKTEDTNKELSLYIESIKEAYWKDFVPNQ